VLAIGDDGSFRVRRLRSAVVKGGYTLVTLPRIVTPYRDTVDGTRGPRNVSKVGLRGNATGLFGVLLVFGRRIKGKIRLRPEQV